MGTIMQKTTSRAIFLLCSLGLLLGACSESTDDGVAQESAETNYDTTLTMQELMAFVLEPAADGLWSTAGWVEDRDGYRELYPTTDEGWEHVVASAAMVAESGNLLTLPGRALDNDAWMIYSEGLTQAGFRAMAAAVTRNKEDLFQAGADIYSVCSACHQAYDPEINSRFTSD